LTTVWVPASATAAHLARLPTPLDIRHLPSEHTSRERLGDSDIVVADFWRVDFLALLDRFNSVRVVQALSAGVEDLVGRIPPGTVLCDAAGVHDIPVAEWVVMVLLAMSHQLPVHIRNQADRRWVATRPDSGAVDLDGMTVLILGYGSIGRAVERRLCPFGVHILRIGRERREGVAPHSRLYDLLPLADAVVILLPVTDETVGLVDRRFLTAMRPGALLVNAARGPIVQTDALVKAVSEGRIRVALDVTDPEPLPQSHPLWSAPDTLITPHIGGTVARVEDRAWEFVGRQVGHYLAGEPLENVVQNGY
jgi:phosphoglycerate dehydrogenase-like enzyme